MQMRKFIKWEHVHYHMCATFGGDITHTIIFIEYSYMNMSCELNITDSYLRHDGTNIQPLLHNYRNQGELQIQNSGE